jgi:hypothetical protein
MDFKTIVGTSSSSITTKDPKTLKSPISNSEKKMENNTTHGSSNPERTPIEAMASKYA